jgi:hypothetical protein
VKRKIRIETTSKTGNFTGKNQQVFSPSFSQNYVANKFFLKIGTNCSVGVYFSLSIESID